MSQRDVSHMFYGPDDCEPAKLLCHGFLRKLDINQAVQYMRFMDGAESFPGALQDNSVTMEIIPMGGVNQDALSLLRNDEIEIFIRRVKK